MDGGVWSRVLSSTAPLRSRIFSSAEDRRGPERFQYPGCQGDGRHPARLDSQTNLHWLQVQPPPHFPLRLRPAPLSCWELVFLLHSPLWGQLYFLCLFFFLLGYNSHNIKFTMWKSTFKHTIQGLCSRFTTLWKIHCHLIPEDFCFDLWSQKMKGMSLIKIKASCVPEAFTVWYVKPFIWYFLFITFFLLKNHDTV